LQQIFLWVGLCQWERVRHILEALYRRPPVSQWSQLQLLQSEVKEPWQWEMRDHHLAPLLAACQPARQAPMGQWQGLLVLQWLDDLELQIYHLER